jgi:hypothetical protein
VFYSRLAKKYTPFTFANEYERELYEKSVKKLVRFREVDDLVKSLHDFTWNIKTIYEDTQRNITNNNLLSRKTEVTDVPSQYYRRSWSRTSKKLFIATFSW